jgi:HTH-type transcriptional regulator/antitoxin HigA
MDIKPIKTERDYRRVMKEIDSLMDARKGSVQGDRLDVLVTLAEAWERDHHAIDAPNPIEAIRFAMEQRGLDRKDLEKFSSAAAPGFQR